MPPDDLGQVRNLDGMLHRTNSATLRGASGEEMLLPSEVYEVLLEVVTAMSKGRPFQSSRRASGSRQEKPQTSSASVGPRS
jgi:hypothetical protein